jgi:DNA modification methylase
MSKCKFCGRIIIVGGSFCKNCGYDPKTDRINPNFVLPSPDQPIQPVKKQSLAISRLGVSPGVKKFALIGLAIFVFSIFYKNHFSITNVIAEVRHTFTMISKGKFKIWEGNNKQIKYIDVRTFKD